MIKRITQKEFEKAENKMNGLLEIVTQRGGFAKLTEKESAALDKYTQIVNEYQNMFI